MHEAMTTANERHADAMASSAVKERPILMSEAMVRACLDGTKTQTRRVLRPQWPRTNTEPKEHSCFPGLWIAYTSDDKLRNGKGEAGGERRCPYGVVGDRLWVRETFFESNEYDSKADAFVTYYRATDAVFFEPDHVLGWHWRPSIFMPRRLSRLTLTITAIHIKPVQDITEAEARAEGVASVAEYRALWNTLNAARGYNWGVNPWVWCVSFARVQP